MDDSTGWVQAKLLFSQRAVRLPTCTHLHVPSCCLVALPRLPRLAGAGAGPGQAGGAQGAGIQEAGGVASRTNGLFMCEKRAWFLMTWLHAYCWNAEYACTSNVR